jgi:opacity protein-like surface antigen
MTTKLHIGLACAALALAVSPAQAADLGNYGGSIKDSYAAPVQMTAAGNCYVRGDVGYSGSGDPEIT